jgi:hypothetical protein
MIMMLLCCTVRVLSDLFENLEAKAKKAKRSSLAHIFLLNNYHFIWKTIKQSNLLAEVGESTLRPLREGKKSIYDMVVILFHLFCTFLSNKHTTQLN